MRTFLLSRVNIGEIFDKNEVNLCKNINYAFESYFKNKILRDVRKIAKTTEKKLMHRNSSALSLYYLTAMKTHFRILPRARRYPI